MSRLLKYIPDHYYKSVFEIDFLNIYKEGIKVLFIDIDNTLAPYDVSYPKEETITLLNNLKEIGFKIILISNNYYKRVFQFSKDLNIPFVHYATKPLKRGFKKGLKLLNYKNKEEVCLIGDQIFTDVLGGNKMGFKTILVTPLKSKTDVWTTKLNRKREKHLLRKISKKHPKLYEERLKEYEKM